MGDRDVTELLEEMRLDWERFGRHDNHDGLSYQVRKLSAADRERLRVVGAVDVRPELEDLPRWKIAIPYHWTQRFPAGRAVRVTHGYAPITGHSNTVGALDAFAKEFPSACLDAATAARLRKEGAHRGWRAVDYILTTREHLATADRRLRARHRARSDPRRHVLLGRQGRESGTAAARRAQEGLRARA